MYEFEDEYGKHVHNLLTSPPYEFKKPITCTGCIAYLEAKQAAWQEKLTVKYGLPKNFWESLPKTVW